MKLVELSFTLAAKLIERGPGGATTSENIAHQFEDLESVSQQLEDADFDPDKNSVDFKKSKTE